MIKYLMPFSMSAVIQNKNYKNKPVKYVIFLITASQIIEFYNFILMAMFINPIQSTFFTNSTYGEYLYLFSIFALGYIVRPLGGIIFGHYGDTKGRKQVFIATIFILSFTTFCMGLIPSYKTIGLIAPVVFIIFRILQGLAMGGELSGSVAFLHEYLPKDKKTFGLSFINFGASWGYILACFAFVLLYTFFPLKEISLFGWRIAFLAGGFFGFLICLLRSITSETFAFKELLKSKQVLRYPIIELIKNNLSNCILGIFIILAWSYATISLIVLPNIILYEKINFPLDYIFELNIYSLCLSATCVLIFAYIIEKLKINIYLFFSGTCFIVIICAYPIVFLLQTGIFICVILTYTFYAVTIAMIDAVILRIISKLFPTTILYSGLSLVINIGTVIAVGILPLVLESALKSTGNINLIIYFLSMAMLFPTFSGLFLFFYSPNKNKFKIFDKEMAILYNFKLHLKHKPLKEYEENELKTTLDSCIQEFSNKNVRFHQILQNKEFTISEEREFYFVCKRFLKDKLDDSYSSLYKYKNLFDSNIGGKYYNYFYSSLLVNAKI
jgi:MFS family permease